MELGLSLGDASKLPLRFLKENNQQQKPTNKTTGFDFCMALGLTSPPIANQQPEKPQEKNQDKEGDDDEDGDDDDDGDGDESDEDDDNDNPNLQLNLLPLAPIPLQICSRPWSSDNGSSENGSSGNLAARGFDVNKLPAAGEEVSSANSPFNLYRNIARNANLQLAGSKRDLEATGNDAVRAFSDDDENALNARKKLRLSKEQSAFLEESFKEHNTLNPKQKLALAKQLNLRPRQVEVWFQNRRARTKLKQTEVDCEYLKRCCETLTEENRRLNKELQELRALKTSNPFYTQLPATTLTMCPSCERVTSTAKAGPAGADPGGPKAKPGPFPLTRPRFYPFAQSPTRPNQPAPS